MDRLHDLCQHRRRRAVPGQLECADLGCLARRLLVGSDNYDEVHFDTYGGQHFVRHCFIELPGQSVSGSTLATAATHTGNGIYISANNLDVSILGVGMGSISYDGINTSASQETIVTGCIIYNCGLASGTYAGIANSGSGYLTVTGSRIGSRAAGNTSQLGISVANGQTLQVTGCDLRLNSLGAIAASSNAAAINASGNFGSSPASAASSPSPRMRPRSQSRTISRWRRTRSRSPGSANWPPGCNGG